MYCPYCQSPNTKVTNSRLTRSNTQVWRRRQCLKCKELFTSHEVIDLSHLIVMKKSGKTQKFSRMKLYSGIYGAVIGSKTPNREEVVDKITREIEREILALRKKQIASTELADINLRVLKRMHLRTFLRYFAYNRELKNEKDMIREFNHYTK